MKLEAPEGGQPRSLSDVGGARARLACRLFLAALSLGALAGCHRDMYDQPRYKPYKESTFFKDGTSFRPIVAGTIARGELREDRHLYFGKDAAGKPVEDFPFPVTDAVMKRGQERFQIYCAPCHGSAGDGRGMIVLRGMTPPPSFHLDRLKQSPVGHYFDVITNGYGAMYRYDYRVPVEDRWAIIAYVRALQFREEVKADELPKGLRDQLEARR